MKIIDHMDVRDKSLVTNIIQYNGLLFCLLAPIFKRSQFYQRQLEFIQNITVAKLLQLSLSKID